MFNGDFNNSENDNGHSFGRAEVGSHNGLAVDVLLKWVMEGSSSRQVDKVEAKIWRLGRICFIDFQIGAWEEANSLRVQNPYLEGLKGGFLMSQFW